MSQPSSLSGIQRASAKQPTNVYTMMLILSLIFLITACVLLGMELNRYPWPPWNVSSAQPAAGA